MGFCLFNNIALAAHAHAPNVQLKRILIVDWDVHHGNGTQDIFYEDPEVYSLSIHRYGHGFYPGTGAADETGHGAGGGLTPSTCPIRSARRAPITATVPHAASRKGRRRSSRNWCCQRRLRRPPRDPIGSLGLETEDFVELTTSCWASPASTPAAR